MSVREELTDPAMAAFMAAFESCYSVLFSSVYARINNYHDAEDICQEVFLRLYDNIDTVENPRKWLFGCLRIVVLDYYKRKESREVVVDDILEDMSMGYVNGFRDTRIMLQDMMKQLMEGEGKDDFPLFELVAVHNFTLAAAARHLNLTYKQARIGYTAMVKRVTHALKQRGIHRIEDLL